MAAAVAHAVPINEPLRRTESEHFIYIYQKSLEARLPALAKHCEDAFTLLTPAMGWTPKHKVCVVYHDGMDTHNGWATVIPRPHVEVFAADAETGSSIYEPDGNLRSTVFHEYTHVLAMDAQYGLGRALVAVFGHVLPIGDPLSLVLAALAAPPGALAPNWYLEGLSIWAETEFVGPGRGRLAVADMIMRMPFVDGRVLRPARWDLRLPEWPFGSAAYLYGMRVIQHAHALGAAGERERNIPGELANAVSRSMLFLFDRRAARVTGQTFGRLAAETLRDEQQRQTERVRALQAVPLTPLAPLTPRRLQVHQPKFGSDNRTIFFCGSTEDARDVLYRFTTGTLELTRLPHVRVWGDMTRMSMTGNRRSLYYTRLNVMGRERYWNELRRYDVMEDAAERVTVRGRYRFPAVSPDGRELAAVRNAGAEHVLVEVPVAGAGRESREVIRAKAPEGRMLVDPVYSPDGRHLLCVEAGRAGSRIRRIERATGREDVLLDWPCIIMTPAFHPGGRELVFSADRNGIYNLYVMAAEPGAEPRPITHVVGGVFEPDFSPDGSKLAACTYDSYGYHLAVLDYEQVKTIAQALPVIEPYWTALAGNQRKVEAAVREPAPAVARSHPYRSLSAIRPDFWAPWLTLSGDGVQGGLATSLSDPTARQNVSVLVGGDSSLGQPVVQLQYSYAGLFPILSVYGSYQPAGYPDLVQDTNAVFYAYGEQLGRAGVQVSLPFENIDNQTTLTLGYQYTDRQVLDDFADEYAGEGLLTANLYEGGEGTLYAQASFFSGTAFPRSHSVENGRLVSAGVEWSDKALGGDLSRVRVLGSWDEYLTLPWGHNHVVKLEGVGGFGAGDSIAQGCFGLGGFASPAASLPGVPASVGVRGYDDNTQVGEYVAKVGAAYRFPLVRLYRGLTATLPVYLEQAFAEIYYEGGMAWGGEPDGVKENDWINAAGMEFAFSTTLFRFLNIAPCIGVAYAPDRPYRRRSPDDPETDDEATLIPYVTFKGSVNF
jgi:Tol biopolymer transport system component